MNWAPDHIKTALRICLPLACVAVMAAMIFRNLLMNARHSAQDARDAECRERIAKRWRELNEKMGIAAESTMKEIGMRADEIYKCKPVQEMEKKIMEPRQLKPSQLSDEKITDIFEGVAALGVGEDLPALRALADAAASHALETAAMWHDEDAEKWGDAATLAAEMREPSALEKFNARERDAQEASRRIRGLKP